MKNITRAELIPLVVEEAIKLKSNATKTELNKLDFSSLNANRAARCIYGQMTGDCFNPRAIKLIEKSCERVIAGSFDGNINGGLNGSPKKVDRMNYWSPIEVYIYRNQVVNKKNLNQNKKIIDFLRNESETLVLR